MQAIALFVFPIAVASVACGASYPAPTQRLADATSAERSAEEVGAASNPQGELHLKLAREEITQARGLMSSGYNKRAEYALVRAKADAELALAIARSAQAKVEVQQAINQVTALESQNTQDMQNAHFPQGAPR